MCLWNEKDGDKSVNCMVTAINTILTKRATGRKHLHWYADNTSSQVKSWKCIRNFQFMVQSGEKYERIDLRFPPKGN